MNDHGNDPLGVDDARNTSQPTELSELITRAQTYMTARFGHFVSDEQMFEMWQLTLSRIEELSAIGDPAFNVERFVADTIPGMLIAHWMEKYKATVLIPAKKLMKRSGIPINDTDIRDVENDVWGILIPKWFRDGKVMCLGRKQPMKKGLQGVRIEDLKECSCVPVTLGQPQTILGHLFFQLPRCKCPKKSPISFKRALFKLTEAAAGHWRSKHRSRDQAPANAKAKGKRKAAKLGIVYVAPPKIDPSEIAWEVPMKKAIGSTSKIPGEITSDNFADYDDFEIGLRDEQIYDDGEAIPEPRVERTKSDEEPETKKDRKLKVPEGKLYKVGLSGNPGARLTVWNSGLVDGGPSSDETKAALDAWKNSHVTKRYHAWQPSYHVRQPTQAEWDTWMENQGTIDADAAVSDSGYQFDTYWKKKADETEQRAIDFAREQRADTSHGKRQATYHRELGKVKLFREISNGQVWVEAKKQRVLVDKADLAETKWPKPKGVIKDEVMAVA